MSGLLKHSYSLMSVIIHIHKSNEGHFHCHGHKCTSCHLLDDFETSQTLNHYNCCGFLRVALTAFFDLSKSMKGHSHCIKLHL